MAQDDLTINIKTNVKGASKDMGDLNKSTDASTIAAGLLGNSLKVVATAWTAIKVKAKMAFATMKAGMISTGIGALLIAFLSLKQYFSDNEKGASKLKMITSALGVVFGNITDIISDLGEKLFNAFSNPKQALADLWKAIKKNLMNRLTGIVDGFKAVGKVIEGVFTMDWDAVKEGALEYGESLTQIATGVDNLFSKATEAVKKFGEQTRTEVNQAIQLEKDRLALQIFEREAIVDKAETEKEMMKLRLQARDFEVYAAEERLVFMREANKLAEEQLEKDLHVAREKLRFRVEENTYSKSTQENLDEEAQLRAAVFNLEKSNFSERKRLKSEEQAIVKEIAATKKAADIAELARIKKIAEERAKAMADQLTQSQLYWGKFFDLNTEMSLLEIEDEQEKADELLRIQKEKDMDSINNMKISSDQKAVLREKLVAKYKLLEEKNLENDKKMDKASLDSKLGAYAQLAGSLSALAGDNKELAAAEAIISTYVGANKAFAQGGTVGFVTGAAIIAQGLANVKKIYDTDVGDGGGSVSATATTPSPQIASGAFTLEGGQEPEPTRAYVVSDDITNSQNKLANIRRRATI